LTRCLPHTVVWSKVCPSPATSRASATPLNISQRHSIIEAIDGERSLMMAGPVIVTLAIAIDQESSDAMGTNRGDSNWFKGLHMPAFVVGHHQVLYF
jgi:hypothetical protein